MTKFKVFTYPLVIKEQHLDTFCHVNNATYLTLLEEARWDFLNTRGVTLQSIQQSGIGPVVLEFSIKFLRELRVRQPILIESQMLSFDKKVGEMKQIILDEQGELCTEAKLVFGVFDLRSRKLIQPTSEWLMAVGMEL